MNPYISLVRPRQYLKNVLIFFPAFFALRITELELLFRTSLGFIGFCAIASSVYILNDYVDLSEDRQHPVKQKRALASGAANLKPAWGVMLVLVSVGLGIFVQLSIEALLLVVAYILLNTAYSFFLKRIPIIDVFVIGLGFLIRIAVGATIEKIPLSMWILLMTFLGALFMGFAKRRADVLLANQGKTVRKSIDGYNLEFINSAMIVMASVLIVAYISYAISPVTQANFQSEHLYLTVFFVLLGILRYMQLTFVEERGGNPTNILLQDRFLQLTILGWVVAFVILIY